MAGAGEAWDVPLCEGYGPNTATTEGRAEVVARGDSVGWAAWAREAALPPRRGRKPGAKEEDTPALAEARGLPSAASETPTEAATLPEARAPGEDGAASAHGRAETHSLGPAPAAPEPAEKGPTLGSPRASASPEAAPLVAEAFALRRTHGPGPRGRWGVALLLVALALAVGWWAGRARPPEQAGREVAHPAPPPDAGPAAAPLQAEVTPVAAASVAVPPQEGESVKKPKSATSAVVQQVKQTVGAAGACIAMACSSAPQVRPPPDAAPCPEKSLKSMERLGISLGVERPTQFVGAPGGAGTFLNVRQGNWQVKLGGGYGEKFRGGTVLSCFLTLSDRVYGRCPSARTADGTNHPVCFELLDTAGALGTPREDDSTGDTARVLSVMQVRPVSRYE